NRDLPWPSPVLIDSSGGTLQSGFTQLLNNYTCGMVPVFDTLQADMYTVFLGGMSWYTYNNANNTWVYDSLVPFVSEVGMLTNYSNGQWAQSVLPLRMNGLQGSNAKFIAVPTQGQYANEVINLRALPGRTLAGYLFGGIKSPQPNDPPISSAVDTVYRVWITPDFLALPVPETAAGISFARLFPNPAAGNVCLRVKTENTEVLRISVTDAQGKIVLQQQQTTQARLQQDIWLNTQVLSAGLYLVKLETKTGMQVLRLSVE
ncbi:MAG: T9SS type A sorting domain-containing protein, partial [Bacteroidia bacterium]